MNSTKLKYFFSILLVATSLSSCNQNDLIISEGILGQIMVVDFKSQNQEDNRVMFVNRIAQTWINTSTNESVWKYVKTIADIVDATNKNNSQTLLLGLGGGTVANKLVKENICKVKAVELDKRIAELATKKFDLNNTVEIQIDDARHNIKTDKSKYDLIVIDLFKGEVPPSYMLTLECFNELKLLLNKDGIIVVNFSGFYNGDEGMATRALMKTITASNFYFNAISTEPKEKDSNILFVISKNKIELNKKDFSILDIDKIPFADADILTDDKPKLETIYAKPAEIWRKDYIKAFSSYFKKSGIPDFY